MNVPVVGCWLLVVGCWLVVVSWWLFEKNNEKKNKNEKRKTRKKNNNFEIKNLPRVLNCVHGPWQAMFLMKRTHPTWFETWSILVPIHQTFAIAIELYEVPFAMSMLHHQLNVRLLGPGIENKKSWKKTK